MTEENEQVSQPEILASSEAKFPFFIHKIKYRNWNTSTELKAKIQGAIELVFNDVDNIYSFWLAVDNENLYAILTELNSGRDSFNEVIDFIWITAEELNALGIHPIPKDEDPICLKVKSLHHNAVIDRSQSFDLCKFLMESLEREPIRCKKSIMKQISIYMQSINCLAHRGDKDDAQCKCELTELSKH